MLTIKDMLGNEAPLYDERGSTSVIYDLAQVPQLQTLVYDSELYHQGFEMIEGRSIIIEPETNQQFIITGRTDTRTMDTMGWQLTALHVMEKLNERYQESTFTGKLSADEAMKRIVANTDFTYTLHDSFTAKTVDSFGNGFALDLFLNTFLSTFGAEFVVDNYHIDIYKTVGQHNSFVFVDGSNISKIETNYTDDTITTHIKGYGKEDDNNKPTITSEYTSPNSKYYGVIDAAPLQEDDVTDQSILDTDTKNAVQDYPLLQLTCEYHEFQKGLTDERDKLNGANDIAIGNYGYVRDRGVVDVEARIVTLQVFPGSEIAPVITFGNVIGDFNAVIAELRANHVVEQATVKRISTRVTLAQNTATKAYNSRIYGEKVGDSDY